MTQTTQTHRNQVAERNEATRICRDTLRKLLASNTLDRHETLPSDAFRSKGSVIRFEIGFGDPATTHSYPKLGLEMLKELLSQGVAQEIPVNVTQPQFALFPLATSAFSPFPVLLRGAVSADKVSLRKDDWLSFSTRTQNQSSERYITLDAMDIRSISLHRPDISPASEYYPQIHSQWEHACSTLSSFLSEFQP